MKNNTMYVVVWLILSFTLIVLGYFTLVGTMHDSDNQVSIAKANHVSNK